MSQKQIYGKIGEDFAAKYLTQHGYQVIDRNFRIRDGEIDIIAIDHDTLACVEVKARHTTEFGSPLEAITHWKLRSLTKAIQLYKLKHPNLPDLMRIDAVAITLNENNQIQTIELVKNIS